jgi:hypothetical protein
VAGIHARDCIGAILFAAILNQLASDFNVIGEWCAGTQLFDPPFGNQIRKFAKPEHRNVDGVSFAGRRVFDEIPPASGTVILNERFAGLDFYPTPLRARPAVAVPYVAIHGRKPPRARTYATRPMEI